LGRSVETKCDFSSFVISINRDDYIFIYEIVSAIDSAIDKRVTRIKIRISKS
jgi:hypothetical protein